MNFPVGGWFGVVVTALVTWKKLNYVDQGNSTGIGDEGLPFRYFSRPLRPTQPGHPCVGRYDEYRQWFWPPLEKKRRVLRNGQTSTITAGILVEVG